MIWTPANPQDLCRVHLHFGNIIFGMGFQSWFLQASGTTCFKHHCGHFQWLLYLHVLFGHHRTYLIWSDNTFACLWRKPLTLGKWVNFCVLLVGPQAQVWRPELGSGIRFGEAKHPGQALYVQIQDSRQCVFALRTLPALHRSRTCVQTLLKSINAMSFLSPKRLQLKRLKKLFRNKLVNTNSVVTGHHRCHHFVTSLPENHVKKVNQVESVYVPNCLFDLAGIFLTLNGLPALGSFIPLWKLVICTFRSSLYIVSPLVLLHQLLLTRTCLTMWSPELT